MDSFYVALQRLIMDDRPRKFVWQDHWRGKSVHLDFRYEAEPGSPTLYGFTVAHQVAGVVKEDVKTLQQAKRMLKRKDVFKLNDNKPTTKRMFSAEKKPEPREWLTYEGCQGPGEVISTSEKYGCIVIRDSGTLDLGAQLPYFREWFLHGKHYTGRWICRLIQRRKPEEAKTAFLWQFGKPVTQTPYVLSRRAEQENWIPPYGASCLPREIREKIPKEYQYWKVKDKQRRIEIRNQLRKLLPKLNITYEGVKLENRKLPYVYQWHYWKKRVIKRVGPSAEHYDLRIEESKTKPLIHFVLYEDILETKLSAGYSKPCEDHSWMTKEGYLPPGTEENPTKDTPAWIKIITKGKVVILERSRAVWKLDFLSGGLKGIWLVEWETPTSNFLTIRKTESL